LLTAAPVTYLPTMRSVPKWTIRADEELRLGYRELCDTNGVSIQAAVEAYIEFAIEGHQAADGRPITDWTYNPPPGLPPEVVAYFVQWVERARAIDAQRRHR
jgi:hypothetical protein